jgi:hypothetical protein
MSSATGLSRRSTSSTAAETEKESPSVEKELKDILKLNYRQLPAISG